MSMVRCDKCEKLIDSDIDCDCFVDPPIMGVQNVLCKWCREDADDRLERAEESAGSLFKEATVRQKAAYDAAMAGLRGLDAPRYERARAAAKADWHRSTEDARDLYHVTCDAIMREGEIPQEVYAEWDALLAREAVIVVMEMA